MIQASVVGNCIYFKSVTDIKDLGSCSGSSERRCLRCVGKVDLANFSAVSIDIE